MRRQFDHVHPCPNAPIAVTLKCVLAMPNCTEVDGSHRNGWTGYTKVYGPACGDGPLWLRSGPQSEARQIPTRYERCARGAVAAARPVATHGSGAPCQFSRPLLDRSNWGRRERSYSPPGRLDNFHKKPKSRDRLVQAQLPMDARPARISRLHE